MMTMGKAMVSKTFMKVMGIAGCILLTVFAGMFAMVGIFALRASIVEPDIIGFIGCAGCACCAWICWSIRKSTLV